MGPEKSINPDCYEVFAPHTIKIAAKRVVKFRVAKAAKDAILGSK